LFLGVCFLHEESNERNSFTTSALAASYPADPELFDGLPTAYSEHHQHENNSDDGFFDKSNS
jgi:hypothetical protein